MDWLNAFASRLPDWEQLGLAGLVGYLLYRARQKIKEGITYWWAHILGGVGYHLRKVIARTVAANLSAWEHAARQLEGPSKFLRVPARGSSDTQVSTDRIFVPLTLEGGERDYDHSSVLDLGRRIRIVGDPGSGKSTILKKMFRDECRRLKRLRFFRHNARLPILFELKTLVVPEDVPDDGLGTWFLEKIRREVDQVRSYKMDHCVDAFLATGAVLVMLDGADEIISEQYPRAERSILALCKELRNLSEKNVVCITMRTQFHKEVGGAYNGEFENPVHVKPFSPTDIYRFLLNWEFKADREHNVTRTFSDLTDRPNLREMCRNPLILSMYVAEDQAGLASDRQGKFGRPVPDSRTAFYRQVVEELLIRRREHQLGPIAARSKVREQRLRILGRLAFDHLLDPSQPANLLQWSTAIEITADVLGLDEGDTAEATFRTLARDTGLIGEDRPGQTFRFIHLTFCEFLAALEAMEGRADGWTTLLSTHKTFLLQGHRSRLNEVLPFAAALAPLHARDSVVQDFGQLSEPTITLMMFLETKHYDHPLWQRHLCKECNRMAIGLRQTATLDLLQEFYLLSVCIRDAESHGVEFAWGGTSFDDYVAGVVTASTRTGGGILDVMAQTDPFACIRIAHICGIDLLQDRPDLVVQHADQPAFLAMVVNLLRDNPGDHSYGARVLFLAGMRSQFVRSELVRANPFESWTDLLTRHPKHRRWVSVLGARSLWSDVLDTVYTRPDASDDLIGTFSKLPYPRMAQLQAGLFSLVGGAKRFVSMLAMLGTFVGLVGSAGAIEKLLSSKGLGLSAAMSQVVQESLPLSVYLIGFMIVFSFPAVLADGMGSFRQALRGSQEIRPVHPWGMQSQLGKFVEAWRDHAQHHSATHLRAESAFAEQRSDTAAE